MLRYFMMIPIAIAIIVLIAAVGITLYDAILKEGIRFLGILVFTGWLLASVLYFSD